MTVVAADFDEDGWPDIYVACDSTPSLLFMNNHDGTFREEGVMRGRGAQRRWHGTGGHGGGHRRLQPGRTSRLVQDAFRRTTPAVSTATMARGTFDEVTRSARVGRGDPLYRVGAPASSISTTTAIPDLFLVTGSVYPEVERKLPQYPNKTPRALFRNLGNGTFEELIDAGRTGRRGSAQQPRMRLRRLRQ